MRRENVRNQTSDFEVFENRSARNRRLLRQEQFILQVAESLVELLEREDVTRSELGRRLGKSKGFVSQILAGDKNLTLRTVADVCDALGFRARMETARDFVAQHQIQSLHVNSVPMPRVNLQDVVQPSPRPEREAAA